MKCRFLKYLILFIFSITINVTHAKPARPVSETLHFHQPLNTTHYWKINPAHIFLLKSPLPKLQFLLAGTLSFIAAAISSAGGIGGGGLFIPILTMVAGLDLKSASSYSAFMVTGGSIANVACQFFVRRDGKPLIDFDIALLSEPCMLLGVSCGVICNLMFPEWLITTFFAGFLALCTFKTCRSGVSFWMLESEGIRRPADDGCLKTVESGGREEGCGESTKVPLLLSGEVGEGKVGIPWMKVGKLVVIWLSFFVVYLLRGNRYGQGIINIKACGTGYWIISFVQVPLAIIFTAWMVHERKTRSNTIETQQENLGEPKSRDSILFPVMALFAGVLGGIFGIGGGMLISPLLLQIGIEPEVTAATCSFMVLFSSTMSAIQYILLGMENINGPLTFAAICFVASLVGLTLVQRAIMMNGRASLIVFSLGTVMALSTVLITGYGAIDVWSDYTSGKSMSFKKPC